MNFFMSMMTLLTYGSKWKKRTSVYWISSSRLLLLPGTLCSLLHLISFCTTAICISYGYILLVNKLNLGTASDRRVIFKPAFIKLKSLCYCQCFMLYFSKLGTLYAHSWYHVTQWIKYFHCKSEYLCVNLLHIM